MPEEYSMHTAPISRFTPYPCQRCGAPGRIDQVCPCTEKEARPIKRASLPRRILRALGWAAIGWTAQSLWTPCP